MADRLTAQGAIETLASALIARFGDKAIHVATNQSTLAGGLTPETWAAIIQHLHRHLPR